MVNAEITNNKENEYVLILTKNGYINRFNVTSIRNQGRATKGVKGISLREKDFVVDALIAKNDEKILVVTENGMGKKTGIEDYRETKRGSKGVMVMKITKRTGNAIKIIGIDDENTEIALLTEKGKILRTGVSSIRTTSKNTQGVKIVSLDADDKVLRADKIANTDSPKKSIDNQEEHIVIEKEISSIQEENFQRTLF